MGMARRERHRPGLHDQAWHYLLGLGPDLAFLQETLPPAWVRAEGTLVHGPLTRWGSVVFSPRFPLQPFPLPKSSHLRALGSYLAFAMATIPDGSDVFVTSVHARADEATQAQLGSLNPMTVKRPSKNRPNVNDIVFAGLEGLAAGNLSYLFAGDWNTAREQGSELNSEIGKEFFDRVHQAGWFECRADTGQEVQTYFRRGGRIKQDDHVFCDRSLGNRLLALWVATDTARPGGLGLSDHAPVILDFEVEAISITSLASEDQRLGRRKRSAPARK
jgi:hypothetical protein